MRNAEHRVTHYIAVIGLVRIRKAADPGDTPAVLRLFASDSSPQP
jgi:hypothetical protein